MLVLVARYQVLGFLVLGFLLPWPWGIKGSRSNTMTLWLSVPGRYVVVVMCGGIRLRRGRRCVAHCIGVGEVEAG